MLYAPIYWTELEARARADFIRDYSTSTGNNELHKDEPPNTPDLPRELTFTNLHEPETREAARKALAGKSGIYCLRCLLDGKCYVGSAVILYDRMCDHLYQNGSQSNLLLQRAI